MNTLITTVCAVPPPGDVEYSCLIVMRFEVLAVDAAVSTISLVVKDCIKNVDAPFAKQFSQTC